MCWFCWGLIYLGSVTTLPYLTNYYTIAIAPTWINPPPSSYSSIRSLQGEEAAPIRQHFGRYCIKIVLLRGENPKTWGESRGRLHRLWSEGSGRLCPRVRAVHWSKPSSWIARCHFMPNSILPHRSKVSMPCLKNSWSVCREFTSMMSITMVRLYS